MTGKELLETVAQMGFAQTLEDGERYFYRAANLSLSRVCRLFPLIGSLRLEAGEGDSIDITEADGAFLGFPASPILGEATGERRQATLLAEGRDYLIRESRVLFLRDAGTVTVYYLRRAREVNEDTAEEPLDIHPAAESLLPLLVASYLWLDDRGELATHYLKLYHTEAEELRRLLYRHGPAQLVSTNGWDKS